MSFTQTSQKFGQWSDVRANTVYGLGFSSEAELTKFVEKFQEVKEATKNAAQKNTTNGSSAATPVTSTNTSPVSGRTGGFQQQQQTDNSDGNIPEPALATSNIQIKVSFDKMLPSIETVFKKKTIENIFISEYQSR